MNVRLARFTSMWLAAVAVFSVCFWYGACDSEKGSRGSAEGQLVAQLLEGLGRDLTNATDEVLADHINTILELEKAVTRKDIPLLAEAFEAVQRDDPVRMWNANGEAWIKTDVAADERSRFLEKEERAFASAEAMCRYYLRTNDEAVRDVFLKAMENGSAELLGILRSVLLRRKHRHPRWGNWGRWMLRPGLEQTDWVETVHSRYRTFRRLESSIEAAKYLHADGRYKEEALWFWCRALADRSARCSPRAISERNDAAEYPREQAVVLAYCAMEEFLERDGDLKNYWAYVIPWTKYLREEGPDCMFIHLRFRSRMPAPGTHLLTETSIVSPASPVPDTPGTVIETRSH